MENLLVLTNNQNSSSIISFLEECGNKVIVWEDKLKLENVISLVPSFIISYNYNYLIKQEIIDYMKGNVINMHISLLPWNRGSSPNIWSFIDGTPKGVTIHKVDASLDTGDILFQKELTFSNEKETFATTYEKLNNAIQELFMENWSKIRNGEAKSYKQQGQGSYHCKSDLEQLQRDIDFTWNDNIQDFLDKYEYKMADTHERKDN